MSKSKKKKSRPSPRSKQHTAVTAERRTRVAELYCQGKPHHEIAKIVGCNVNTVTDDMQANRAEWRERREFAMDKSIEEQLAKIDEAERAAWVAYERSVQNAVAKITTTDDDGKTTTRDEERGQAGDPRFIDIVLRCVKQRCELLGLDAPKKTEVKVDYQPPLTRAELTAKLLEIRARNQANVPPQ